MASPRPRFLVVLRCLVYGTALIAVVAEVILQATEAGWHAGFDGSSLDEVHRHYLEAEGPAHRGARFEGVAHWISRDIAVGRPHPLAEVLRYLGPADDVDREDGRETYKCYYRKPGAEDAYIAVSTDASGKVVIGFGRRAWEQEPGKGAARAAAE